MAGIEARLGMSLDDIIKKTKEVAKVCVCLAVRARRARWIAESGLRVAGRGSVVRARGGAPAQTHIALALLAIGKAGGLPPALPFAHPTSARSR